ncbi:ArnT family glycosyltransferase [Geovibrio thiophilus]|nr:glycosyltransferase family 39 protein [Geovibrio thiophilus]
MKDTEFLLTKSMIFVLLLSVYTGAFAHRDVLSVDIMEARNYITAREMVLDGNWLFPTLNGELRIAKPPVPTWITAFVFRLAGADNNLAASRIPSALAGLIMLAGVYFISLHVTRSKKAAFYSVIVLSTSYLFFYMTRRNTWDIYAQAFMTAAIAAYCRALPAKEAGERILMYALAGLFAALSFMSKGPVAFYGLLLPFLASGFYLFRLKPVSFSGLAVFSAVAATLSLLWPMYIYFHETHSALSTAASEASAWADRHVKPFWYYFQFPLMSGLWAVFLLPLLVPGFSSTRLGRRRAAFYLIWLVVSLILLSVIPEKKDRYLLPVIIPAALMIGEYMSLLTGKLKKTAADSIVLGIWSGISFSLAVFVFISAAAAQLWFGLYNSMFFIIGESAVLYAVFCLSASFLRRETDKYIPLSVTVFCLAVIVAVPAAESFVPDKDFRVLEQVRADAASGYKGDFYGDLSIKEIWAVGNKVRPLDEFIDNKTKDTAYFITRGELNEETLSSMALSAEHLKTYSPEERRQWNFYKISRKK